MAQLGIAAGCSPPSLPARLSPIKGQALLIEALARVPTALVPMTVIVGDDQGRTDYRHELERLIKTRGLDQRVKLVSNCSDMPAAYSLASLVVAPSLISEGFGRVPIEAMAMEVPIIASRLGGHMETIRSGENGWLFNPHDAEHLSVMIAEVLRLPVTTRTAIMQKARLEAASHYSKSKVNAHVLEVYAELAAQRSK